ncbi:hypothetical protein C0V72_10205 [Porphyrobacter sp. TH134]|uniref:hypothetical protein n=1 Tax=Porphyrobacter sp. TH134 TaxID=2067450 RepID=UPI000C79DF5D|nr:hypothetical protein [Porphyrobacter sp. TH134]PLK23325.1 hypothetical protein C0V72_10205 [Porphyrobacter sp. TH134]
MRMLTLTLVLAGLAACGSETGADTGADGAPDPAGTSTAGSVTAAALTSETTPATRAEVEEAWKCRGLVSAAAAAQKIMPAGDVPAKIMEITPAIVGYWDDRAGRLKAPDMADADVDALVVSSTRVLATREALERELPVISACIDKQKAG